MIWAALAGFSLFAILAAVAPLFARRIADDGAAPDSRQAAIEFYKSQLSEIERDAGAGLMGADEAEAARAEAGRRLLTAERAAGATAQPARQTPLRAIAVVLALLVPAFSLGVYAVIGRPDLPDLPRAARVEETKAETQVVDAVRNIEKHLAVNPDDGRGWQVLAPVYLKLGRMPEAVNAFRQSLRLNGESAERLADYAEALIFAANGEVGADARDALARAVALDPKASKPRYYLGLAADKAGDAAKAAEIWSKLAADQPPGSPLAQALRERVARLEGKPSAADVASLPPEARDASIREMVHGLADRLGKEGGDAESWMRLVRAWTVLKEQDKARAALAEARKAFGADARTSERLDALARELGLEG